MYVEIIFLEAVLVHVQSKIEHFLQEPISSFNYLKNHRTVSSFPQYIDRAPVYKITNYNFHVISKYNISFPGQQAKDFLFRKCRNFDFS